MVTVLGGTTDASALVVEIVMSKDSTCSVSSSSMIVMFRHITVSVLALKVNT